MKTLGRRRSRLVTTWLMLALFVAVGGSAQQSSPSPAPASPGLKPAALPASTPAPPSTGSPAASREKVVLRVGGDQVTQADIDFVLANVAPQAQQSVTTQGRRPLGEQYILMLVLSQQALNDHLDGATDFRQHIAFERMRMLAQAEYQRLAGQTKVGPEEVAQYYSAHPADFDEVQVRQAVVRKKPDGAKEGTTGFSAAEARAKIEAIRKAFAAGTDPKKMAEDFKAPNEILIDSDPRALRRGQLPPALERTAFELKEGELSEISETAAAFIFVQLVARKHEELSQASSGIENTLRQQKLEAVVNDLKKKTTIWMDEDYFKPPTPALTLQPAIPERDTRP